MAYLLRALIVIMLSAICLTVIVALNWIELEFSHIQLAIPAFIYTIFAQAFVMFYFIGVSRLVNNVYNVLHSEKNLNELFDQPPSDLAPYIKKTKRHVHESTLSKRQTIPWTMLILTLGTIGFLLGGAHDTGMVTKIIHSGTIYGFLVALFIGFFKQWSHLGKSHKLLRDLKNLYGLSNDAM